MKSFLKIFLSVLPLYFVASSASAFSLTLTTSLPNPQPIGTPIEIQAVVEGADPGADIVYQFAVTTPGKPLMVLQTFRDNATFEWATIDRGAYLLVVVAVDRTTQELKVATTPFVRGGPPGPAVLPTAHPQVFILSVPECPVGAEAMRVQFRPSNQSGPVNATHFKPCIPGLGVSHYVGGMVANSSYTMTPQFAAGGSLFDAAPMVATTGASPFTQDWLIFVPPTAASGEEDVVLASPLNRSDSVWAFATNLLGQPIWSYINPEVDRAWFVQPAPGGTFFTLDTLPDGRAAQLLREVDMAGNIVRETNAEAVSSQLLDMGLDPMGGFHHEVQRLPSGHTIVLASVERFLTDVQGPGEVHVYGEYVLALDPNFKVVWTWNSFDKIDNARGPILGQTCTNDVEGQAAQGGCPWLELGDGPANDWLHANSLGFSPDDGNIVINARHLDAAFKINYANGQGNGDIVWELGEAGDFTLSGGETEAWPWFSHAHTAHYQRDGEFVVYDNGNTRQDALGEEENTRCQSYVLDEINMTADLVANVDLGFYAAAVGSAQRLRNGNYHCGTGWLGTFQDPASASMTVSDGGTATWAKIGQGRWYRSIRMQSLYAK